jgi:surfeit locus 1 family protein
MEWLRAPLASVDGKTNTRNADARAWLRRSAAIPTLAAFAGAAVFVLAGNWQRARMEHKEALREQHDSASRAAPVALPAGEVDWPALRYRKVELAGRYDAPSQVLLDNRVHRGRAGYHVVTPLILSEGRAVVVNRGWVAAGATRSEIPLVPPPAGEVVVRGRIALPSEGLDLGDDARGGPVRQRLDLARFPTARGVRVLPVVVEQSDDGAPSDGLVRAWPQPDFGIEKHRIYMVQWYLFAALSIGLWAWFVARPFVLGSKAR